MYVWCFCFQPPWALHLVTNHCPSPRPHVFTLPCKLIKAFFFCFISVPFYRLFSDRSFVIRVLSFYIFHCHFFHAFTNLHFVIDASAKINANIQLCPCVLFMYNLTLHLCQMTALVCISWLPLFSLVLCMFRCQTRIVLGE